VPVAAGDAGRGRPGGPWDATHQATWADAIRLLRELEWPNTLPSLPGHVARLFARALERAWRSSGCGGDPHRNPAGAAAGARVVALGGARARARRLRGVDRTVAADDGRKAASKPLELLRLLAAHGTEAVRVDLIAESLWPGDGREGRQKAFDVTVARLRRLLDCDAAVIVYDHRARLNGEIVWTDVQALGDHWRGGGAAAGSVDAVPRSTPRCFSTAAPASPTAPSRGRGPPHFACASGSQPRCSVSCAPVTPERRNGESGFFARAPPIRCSGR
jgi:hypothetical protein